MKIADFSANSFFNKVQSSTKTTHSSTPQLTLSSTKDKFILNPAAISMMGVSINAKDRIMIMDLNKGEEDNPSGQKELGERFYIAVNKYMTDNRKGLLSKGGEFAYTTVWAAMLMNKPEITQCPHSDLAKEGIVLERVSEKTGHSAYISYKKLTFDLERVELEDGTNEFPVVEGGEPQPVYALTNVQEIAHTPEIAKVAKSEDENEAAKSEDENEVGFED